MQGVFELAFAGQQHRLMVAEDLLVARLIGCSRCEPMLYILERLGVLAGFKFAQNAQGDGWTGPAG